MNKLETLLNTLIARGRKPRNKEKVALISIVGDQLRLLEADGSIYTPYSPRLRELVSLESGLWQFVCKEELTRGYDGEEWKYTETFPGDYKDYPADEHQYRLIESALVPEEELAQFLLDNIKVEGKKE